MKALLLLFLCGICVVGQQVPGRGGRGGRGPRTRKAVLAWADIRNGILQHDSTSHALALIERLGYESGMWDLRRIPGGTSTRRRFLVSEEEKARLQAVYWDSEGHRTANTIARPVAVVAQLASLLLPPDKKFLIVREENIGKEYPFSTEKLGIVLSIFKYNAFD